MKSLSEYPNMSGGVVLSLFDHSTVMVQPWANEGHVCLCVDIQHPPGFHRSAHHENIWLVGADILEWLPPLARYRMVFAFPPCTHLAVSGARWFKGKGLGLLADSIRLFHRAAQIAEWTGAPYLIENPASTISTYWRKPDYTFNPSDYGDPYTKLTCLWTSEDFVMPEKAPVTPVLGSKMHRLPPGPERANLRSATPPGFSRAVFTSNCYRIHAQS